MLVALFTGLIAPTAVPDLLTGRRSVFARQADDPEAQEAEPWIAQDGEQFESPTDCDTCAAAEALDH